MQSVCIIFVLVSRGLRKARNYTFIQTIYAMNYCQRTQGHNVLRYNSGDLECNFVSHPIFRCPSLLGNDMWELAVACVVLFVARFIMWVSFSRNSNRPRFNLHFVLRERFTRNDYQGRAQKVCFRDGLHVTRFDNVMPFKRIICFIQNCNLPLFLLRAS